MLLGTRPTFGTEASTLHTLAKQVTMQSIRAIFVICDCDGMTCTLRTQWKRQKPEPRGSRFHPAVKEHSVGAKV